MKRFMAAFALAGALTLAIPAVPADAADKSPQAIQMAESAVRQARNDMRATFGQTTLRNGQHLWKQGASGAEVTRIVLDLSRQLAFAYREDDLVAVSTISSGSKNHLSPIGVFPILEKKRHHRSNRYNDAPMPYMQRLNEYGVALHAGHLPGYPASHGCVRLPQAFAAKLFAATRIGTEVVIAEPEGPPSGRA